MTGFGYWQSVAAKMGRFMCDICFDTFPYEDAWRDGDGERWTLCTVCGDAEEVTKTRRVSD